MQIVLDNAGKRIHEKWIFQSKNYIFNAGETWYITGPNGSGKTTFLLCVCGFYFLSEGMLRWQDNHNQIIDTRKYAQYVSICSPHMHLPEEMTVRECLALCAKFNADTQQMTVDQIIDQAHLQHIVHKPIGQLSSGTKQRIKLAQAIFSNTPVLLLDEHLSHLDKDTSEWAEERVSTLSQSKLVLIATNDSTKVIANQVRHIEMEYQD